MGTVSNSSITPVPSEIGFTGFALTEFVPGRLRERHDSISRSVPSRLPTNVSQPTARDYFDIAHGTFIWRAIPAYTRDVVKRTVKHPKGYLRDSGLLHALLRLPDSDALLVHPQMGGSWEGMVVEEILRQLSAVGVAHQCSYYRTSAGAEVDLVVEGGFGRVAVEIKHTSTVGGRDLRSLRDFVRDQKARLGLVINNDVAPRQYDDDLIGLPFTWL